MTTMTLLAMWGDAWWSRAITRLTDGGPSHVALGFENDSFPGEYYEALAGHRVRGPIPYQDAQDWAAKRPKTRRLEFVKLSEDRCLVDRKLKTAQMWVRAAGYGHLQIVAMLLFLKFGWRVPPSMGRVVCSELVARILWPDIDVTEGHDFDAVTPANVWRAALKRI
jgi:hypothetical protein